MKTNSRFLTVVSKPVLSAAAVLTVIALGLWMLQISRGLGLTGLTQDSVWGMYIAGFFTAAGAGAGILFIAGINIFFKDDMFEAGALLRLLSAALACFAAAGVLILMDIGKISNIFSMIFSFNYASAMTQDFWALTLGIIVSLWGLIKVRSGQPGPALGVACLVVSLGLIFVEGLMLARVSAHSFWGSGTIAGFLAGMAVAGCAVALLVLKPQAAPRIRKPLMIALVVSALLAIAEVLTLAASPAEAASLELASTLAGSASPVFWIYVLAGIVLPLALLFRSQNPSTLRIAGALAVLGVLAEKLWVLIVGLEHPLVAIPGRVPYHISPVELFTVIGTVGLAVLAYVVIMGIFNSDTAVQAPEPVKMAQPQ